MLYQLGGFIMWQSIANFFTSVSLSEILLIFFAKIIEVSIGTLRIIFIGKGYRKQGTILAVIEILLWVFIASKVIVGITQAPLKGIIYSIGFAAGVYVGSILEAKLAVGKVYIQAIIMREEASKVVNAVREAGYGATVLSAQGKFKSRKVLMVFTNRKEKDQVIGIINQMDDDALVVVNDVSLVQGGYVGNWHKLVK